MELVIFEKGAKGEKDAIHLGKGRTLKGLRWQLGGACRWSTGCTCVCVGEKGSDEAKRVC